MRVWDAVRACRTSQDAVAAGGHQVAGPLGDGPPCGVCGGGPHHEFETCMDSQGNIVEVRQCAECGVLSNVSAVDHEDAEAHDRAQAEGLEGVYSGQTSDAATVERGVEINARMLMSLLEMMEPPRRRSFLDVGAGAGHMSLAAAQRFERVVSVDLRPDLFELSASLYGRPGNVNSVKDLSQAEGEFDCVFMWHVLEHIPESLKFMRGLRAKMSDAGVLLLQVPAYRPDHVMPVHHHHHNARSLRVLADRAAFEQPLLSYDVQNGFITALLRARA